MHMVDFQLGTEPIRIESGQIARRANGAVVVKHRGSFVLGTVVCNPADTGSDFLPLTVDYREKMAAAGRIPGNFFRREARPSEFETLTSRLIDRTLRPLFPSAYNCPTVVEVTVYSADESSDMNALALIAASAAVHISDIPFAGPVAGARVLLSAGRSVIPASPEHVDSAELDMILSATSGGLVMLEGGGNFVSEETVITAIDDAIEALAPTLNALNELRAKVGVPKFELTAPGFNIQDASDFVHGQVGDALDEAIATTNKASRRQHLADCGQTLAANAGEWDPSILSAELNRLRKQKTRAMILAGKRVDGRDHLSVRDIDCQVGFLEGSHGSSLFTRGDTQALVSATIGGAREAQDIETLQGMYRNRFILHYNFPGFAVGEPRRSGGGAGRREIGHGFLARRALSAALPTQSEWPYTTRLVSDITESDGSSSMATVCGGALALMSAGVPIKAPVAGIAMGLIKENENTAILTDILGEEDHLGDMDFKVAGNSDGISALQMDNKIGSLPRSLLATALSQARAARLHILERMQPAVETIKATASTRQGRHASFPIPVGRIGAVVGTGGKVLQGIQSKTNTRIEVSKEGNVLIMGRKPDDVQAARQAIEQITLELRLNAPYRAEIRQLKDFGVFVKIGYHEGLVHQSELGDGVALTSLNVGDEILVAVIGTDQRGRLRLSQRAASMYDRQDAINAERV